MRFLKIRASIIPLFFLFLVNCNARANEKEPIAICLTGRMVLNFPTFGKSFVNSANLAVEQLDMKKSVVIKKYFYDDRPLSAIFAYKKMIKEHCSAIIGFEYLSDLLLVAKGQGENKIPIFTSFASTLGDNNLPKNIFVFMPSYRFLADTMVNYAQNLGPFKHVLLITEINRDSMKQYQHAYIEKFKKDNIQYKTLEILENDSDLIPTLNSFLENNEKFDYVFLLAGVIASAKIMNELHDEKMLFFGTENFGSSTGQSLYIRLTDKNLHAYFIRNFDSIKRSEKLESFEGAYEKRFHQIPLSLSAYTYDATMIILNSIKGYNNVNLENMLKTHYAGASGISIKNGVFYRSPEYIILKVTPSGYQYVESITD